MSEFLTFTRVALGETGNPFLDVNPFEDGAQPWYEAVRQRLVDNPELFGTFVQIIEESQHQRKTP